MSQARLRSILVVLGLIVALAGTAQAERNQHGRLIVSLKGGLSPLTLPRDHAAPVAVSLEGAVDTADHSPLPRVNRLKLELAWRGDLLTKGLPTCSALRLKGLRTDQALATCGEALVGRGNLKATIFVPGQHPFAVRAHLLAFNGRTKVGRRAVLVYAYTMNPPMSFVIPFVVHRHSGAFQTVLVATVRRSLGTWPHVADFRVEIARSFKFRGKRHSYLNASCPLPKNFTAGFLSFARATYTFEGGEQLRVASVRTCRSR